MNDVKVIMQLSEIINCAYNFSFSMTYLSLSLSEAGAVFAHIKIHAHKYSHLWRSAFFTLTRCNLTFRCYQIYMIIYDRYCTGSIEFDSLYNSFLILLLQMKCVQNETKHSIYILRWNVAHQATFVYNISTWLAFHQLAWHIYYTDYWMNFEY